MSKYKLSFDHRFQRKRLKLGVLQRGTFLTLRPLPRKVLMWRKLSNALPRTRWRAGKKKNCKFLNNSYFLHLLHRGFGLNILLSFSLSLDTCQTQSMLGRAINRGLQGVNAKDYHQKETRPLLPFSLFTSYLKLLHVVNFSFVWKRDENKKRKNPKKTRIV